MQYVSPYRLWQALEGDAAIEHFPELRQFRKRLLLERDLAGDAFLVLDGREYSGDDILRLCEQWEQTPELWDFHRKVLEYPLLLAVLEKGIWWGEMLPDAAQFGPEEGVMRQYLGGYLAPVLQQALKRVFVHRDFRTGRQCLQQLDLLDEAKRSLMYAEILHRGTGLCREIELHTRLEKPLHKEHWRFLEREDFYLFFNTPGEGFAGIRNRIALAVNNQFAMQINKRKGILFTGAVLVQALKLDCSEDYRVYLMRNRQRVFEPSDLFQALLIGFVMLVFCIGLIWLVQYTNRPF